MLVTDPYLGWILSGLLWTILVAAAGWIIALVLGTVIGIARTVRSRVVRALAAVYVEVFRNIPLLVQIFLFYFVLPEVLPRAAGRWLKRELPEPEFWTAVVSLGLYTACRVAEQVRSGIQSIPQGQTFAGLATGLTRRQVYRWIILPVAYRTTIPAFTSEFLNIFKNSSLALTIGVLELTSRTRQVSEQTFHPIEAFAAASGLYALITLIITLLMSVVERRLRIPGTIAMEAR
ncbi:MAG TPA: amino acid ABC transporter permease [Microvirga sp.]|nr:amino acid ABC transporter permease [Microvirga sp.]